MKIDKRIGGIFGSIQLGIEEAAWYFNALETQGG